MKVYDRDLWGWRMRPVRSSIPLLICAAAWFGWAAEACAAGKIRITVVDADTKQPIPFRLHLRNEKQVPVKVPKVPTWHDHVSIPGTIELELYRGNYFFEIEHGPEYKFVTGHLTMIDGGDDEKTVELKRIADMPREHWWSADLDVRRPPRDVAAAMEADDVHVAPLTTWTNRKNDWQKTKPPLQPVVAFADDRFVQLMAGGDDRDGGPIGLFNLAQVPPLPTVPKTIVGLVPSLRELKAKHESLWIDVGHPNAWDLPILLAHGLVDSYRVLPSTLSSAKVDKTPFGKPFDRTLYAGDDGPTRFACDVYFHMLNCGLRVAPSAGSGSGLAPNPIGYNRVYVACERSQLDYPSWWEHYKLGRAMITNGPLLQPKANDLLPGGLIEGAAGVSVDLDIWTNLTTRDTIEYLEVVQNGKVLHTVRLGDWAKTGHFPATKFTESGWCLLRVACLNAKTYRMAMTAPWYVEIGGKPRVSKTSAQFFLDWLEERAKMLKVADDKERAAAEKTIGEARAYWQKLVAEANAP